jgi:hypothetical protein
VDWNNIAPMIVGVVFIVTAGGVLILRPIAKRLGELIELYARDRESGLRTEVSQLRDLLETTSARLRLIEERQDFTERLLEPGDAGSRRVPTGLDVPRFPGAR